MDARHFDDLICSLSSATSRRVLVARLARGLLAVLPLAPAGELAGAKKRRKRKKKRRRRCSCAGKNCGDDGCGRSCGTCTGGTCQGGTCICPSGMEACGGECVVACGGVTVRNSRTCTCCLLPRTHCASDDACCTEHCSVGHCTGFDRGEPCDFDGECFFGSCDNGACN
ncbi:MAG: hypothetical protein ACRDJC_09865 [Thermomicrobiales bacterium]